MSCPRWAPWWPLPRPSGSGGKPSSPTSSLRSAGSSCCAASASLLVVAQREALALAAPDHRLLHALVLAGDRIGRLLVARPGEPVDQLVGAVALEEVGPGREPVEPV